MLADLSGKVKKTERHYFAFGGFADIWKGEWDDDVAGQRVQVAVKLIRGIWSDTEYLARLSQKLVREGRVWSGLNHPNITPFFGLCFDLDQRLAPGLVCPYYSHGDVSSYLRQFPTADRMLLVTQVAAGLSYLHDFHPHPVIHGDIKASNILVNDKHEAVLTDFGLSRILETTGFTNKLTGGTCRWMAHELIAPRDDDDDYSPPVTTATDVWAFAMTVIEILTGRIPFSHIKYDTAVILSVIKNGRPLRQTSPEIGDETWSVLQRCWDADTARRPSMRSLALFFDISHWFFPEPLSASQVDQIFHSFNENTHRGGRYLSILPGGLVDWFSACIGRCKRVFGNPRSTHESPQKRRDELPYRCNWPRCRDGFRTLRDCQEHELHHEHFIQSTGKCYESIRPGVP